MNIVSRLTNIGGTLGYGRQEDAHEFMRYAIDMMQSVSLDEYGGEKLVPPRCQETYSLYIHYTLFSQVQCTVCNNVSDQYENMWKFMEMRCHWRNVLISLQPPSGFLLFCELSLKTMSTLFCFVNFLLFLDSCLNAFMFILDLMFQLAFISF